VKNLRKFPETDLEAGIVLVGCQAGAGRLDDAKANPVLVTVGFRLAQHQPTCIPKFSNVNSADWEFV
jgi:hypothetical protein